ncbi:TetR/AcrR family transcriptional regulator [Microlunatus ginsengisoli]|uniref:TetR family transcriptional regulator n=1 Tax=Microlunatus ginsengisoli TaxID=363863 RepID=A0ABP6ZDF2_9ACTN
MVRPRFARLPAEQQQAILDAALDEFAEHGFHDASLNRVIEAAGISKGSMYYYFDGKEDLYASVARAGLEQLFADVGPFPVPTAEDPDGFWATLADYYLRLMTNLAASPRLAALLRGWAVSGSALRQAAGELEQAVLPWMQQTLAAGQRVGAIRTDLPPALLIGVVSGMGQAMDGWLLAQDAADVDLPDVIGVLTDLLRRVLAP